MDPQVAEQPWFGPRSSKSGNRGEGIDEEGLKEGEEAAAGWTWYEAGVEVEDEDG